MNNIVMIPVGDLEHHPENPRKDLGDLTELAESIRQRGIMQNLTVVPDLDRAKYLIVIGNRRFEAAKMAGLVDLPCVISDMDHKEQIATMLMENMQRQDLTVYEQAQGFQMMMDLGFSTKEIGEKTGFSEKTVKDRIKLTKLNQKKFGEAVGAGATLLDLIEVSKLKKASDQNEVLSTAGTDNFRYKLQRKIKEQEFEENRERLEPVCKEFAEPMPEKWNYGNYQEIYSHDLRMSKKEDATRKAIKALIKDEAGPFFYMFRQYSDEGHIEIYYRKVGTGGKLTDEQKTERQMAIARGKHVRKVKGYWAEAYELRKDFVKNYTVAQGQSASTLGRILIRYALDQKASWGGGRLTEDHKWNDQYIREVLGIPEDPQKNDKDEYITLWKMVEQRTDIPVVRIMLAWAVGGGIFWPDSPDHGLYDSRDGSFNPGSWQNNGLTNLYQFLQECGYGMSDAEKALMDGTHDCYQEE